MDILQIVMEQDKILYLGTFDMPVWLVSAVSLYARAQAKTRQSLVQHLLRVAYDKNLKIVYGIWKKK